MEFWNNVSKKVGEMADVTARETERLAAIAKLKYRLRTQRSKLSSLFREIGQLCYRERAGELDEDSTEISELCERAAELKTQIMITKQSIESLKMVSGEHEARICPTCGTALCEDMLYCHKCGTKFPDAEEDGEGENDL